MSIVRDFVMENQCNATLRPALIVMSVTGGAAVLTCLLAASLVAVKKLYELLAYRLALYHVITGLLSGAACVLESISLLYYDRPANEDPPHACIAVAFTIQYFVWMKLCLTFWVTFHLFFYAVFYKNLKKLELVYVLTSLFVPAIVSVVPFITGSYGLAGSWCWIMTSTCAGKSEETDAGVIEQFALWYIPSISLLFLDCIVVVVMVAVLSYRTYAERKGIKEALLVTKRPLLQQSALRQLLPLLAYPVTWCALSVPPVVDRVFGAMNARQDALTVANAFCTSAWSLAAGVTLIVHISLVSARKRRYDTRESSAPTALSANEDQSEHSLNWNSNYGIGEGVPAMDSKHVMSEFKRSTEQS